MKLSAVLDFLHESINCQPIELLSITIDSRAVLPGALFVAVPGNKADGRDYIQQALQLGAAAILIADPSTSATLNTDPNYPDVPIIGIPNLTARIPMLAAFFYGNPAQQLQIIGITGTNGKTSISHYTAQILAFAKIQCGVMGTLGNGVLGQLQASALTTSYPCTVQQQFAKFVAAQIGVVAMEVSSHALAQGRLAGTKFKTAVFTNLTQDHLDYHTDMQDYFACKTRLFTEYNPDNCVLNLDDEYGQQLKQILVANSSAQIITYSLNNSAADIYLDGATIHTPWGSGKLNSPLIGGFNRSNLLACIACCALQGLELPLILAAVASLQSVPGRMQVVNNQGDDPLVVIDYAHTPDALVQALKALREHADNQAAKIYCVFGCGGDRDRSKRSLMLDAVMVHSDYVIITQDNPRTEDPQQIVADMLNQRTPNSQINIILDRAQAIYDTIKQANGLDLILIAGKGHEDYQIIGTKKFPFSDVTVAQQALTNIRGKSA